MTKYDIVAVLWEDHIAVQGELPKDPDILTETPTLTVGFLYKETDKSLTVVHSVEPYSGRDEANYTVILKGTVVGIKRYGKIKLRKLRRGGPT